MRALITATALIAALFIGSANAQNKDMANKETAIFAGGCFWCVESDFDHVPGVLETVSGYIGGTSENPTYKDHGYAKHLEAVQITYDPAVISYETMLDIFWHSVDPTDGGGQFCDRGHSYTTAIFAQDAGQRKVAEASKAALQGMVKDAIVTPVRDAAAFWPAEEYHQNYHAKKPLRYKFYRSRCGRDRQVERLWGDMARLGIPKS